MSADRAAEAAAFIALMHGRDPAELERDRAEAWARPGDAYADELLRYEAPEDGEESPFGWVGPYTPAVAVWETPEAPRVPKAPHSPSSENPTSDLRHP